MEQQDDLEILAEETRMRIRAEILHKEKVELCPFCSNHETKETSRESVSQ